MGDICFVLLFSLFIAHVSGPRRRDRPPYSKSMYNILYSILITVQHTVHCTVCVHHVHCDAVSAQTEGGSEWGHSLPPTLKG